MERLHRHFDRDHFVLLNVDVGEPVHKVRRFALEEGLSFPILLDRNSTVASNYGVLSHPMAYLIGPEGNILGVAYGYREWDRREMRSLIRSLLQRRG